MSKKMLKRSLALGALMAFVITGSAFADVTKYEGTKWNGDKYIFYALNGTEDTISQSSNLIDKALGGEYNATNGTIKTTNLNVTGGTFDIVTGGYFSNKYDEKTLTNLNGTTLNILGKEVKALTVVGGSVASYTSAVDYKTNNTNLYINSGIFGDAGIIGNCPDTVVIAGDLLKWGSDGGKTPGNLVSYVGSTNLVISNGTFNSVIIGGSSAVQNYSNTAEKIETNVGIANTTITGGTFNRPIVAGGLAWAHNTTSTVGTANLTISGANGNLTLGEKADIFAGGAYGEHSGYSERISTVGSANIKIDNVTAKDIYGTAVEWKLPDQANFREFFTELEDNVVNTTLSLTNVTANNVDIPEGSVTLRVEGNDDNSYIKIGQSENATGLTVAEDGSVPVSVEADGEVNDAYAGDYNKMIKERFLVNGYKLLEENEETGETSLNIDAMTVEEGEVMGAATLNSDGTVTVNANQGNTGISDISSVALMAWRAETNDMNKRLGELRNANGEHGVWVRMVRGESEYNSVKNQYNQYQLGYDEKLSVDKSWTVGMALSYTDAESSFSQGTGENTHKGLAIYGSKLNDDGSFVDLIAKYSRLEHDFDLGTAKGDYDTNGYSVSAEYGKRFQQGNGLWIEPQVELTYGQVDSATYMVGGRTVNQDSMESLVGRVGFSLGKDISKGNVYARASYLYDFEGETSATYTKGDSQGFFEQDLGGGWWEVGVGANINLSKATYIYADVEKTFGGEVDTNWQWNLGVRYSF